MATDCLCSLRFGRRRSGLVSTGTWLLVFTLAFTAWAAVSARQAAKATARAATIAGHAARVELRAYLSVIPAGVNEMIGNGRAMGHVDVKNVGKLLARNVWVQVRMKIDDRESVPDERADVFPIAKDPKRVDPNFNVDRAIHPETAMRQGAVEEDTLPVKDLLAAERVGKYVYVWGVAFYDDGYKRRETRFRHRYAIAGRIQGKDWTFPANETREIISVGMARFDPYGNSAN